MTAPDAPATGVAAVTPAMRHYLKAVYRLRECAGQVTTQRLAEALAVSSPSVTNMVKRLHALGLLHHTRYHGVELTADGERIALNALRRHRLLETYLVTTLGFGWDAVHDEAERLEHSLSDELEDRLDAALGHPTHDPHGDPIPTREGIVAGRAVIALADLEPGTRGTVARVPDGDRERLRYLEHLGLAPGAVVAVAERMPFDGPLRIVVGDADHAIGRALASSIQVVLPSAA